MAEQPDHGGLLLERALARLQTLSPADRLQMANLAPALVDALGEYVALTDNGHRWVIDLAGGAEPAGPPAPAARAACVEVLSEAILRIAQSDRAPKRVADCVTLAVPSLFVAGGPGLAWLGFEPFTPPAIEQPAAAARAPGAGTAPTSPTKPKLPPIPEPEAPAFAMTDLPPSAEAHDTAADQLRSAVPEPAAFGGLPHDNPLGDLSYTITWDELPNPMVSIHCHQTFAGVCAEFGQPYPHQTEMDRLVEEARRRKSTPAGATSASGGGRGGIGHGLR